MAADGAGGGAGRVDQHKGRGRRKIACIGFNDLGGKFGAGQVFLNARGAGGSISTAVTNAPAAANCMVLPPGAAHRSITRLPFTSPSRCMGSGCGTVLYPPIAFGKAGQVFDAAWIGQPPHWSEQRLAWRKCCAWRFQNDVNRRGVLMGARDQARGSGIILRRPARPQPVRRRQAFAVQARQYAGAFARDLAQHSIDQRLEMHRLGVLRGQAGWRHPPRHAAALAGSEVRRPPAADISLAAPALCGASGLATKRRSTASSAPIWRKVSLTRARAKPASRVARPAS